MKTAHETLPRSLVHRHFGPAADASDGGAASWSRARHLLTARLSAGPRLELVDADGVRSGRSASLILAVPLLTTGYLGVLAGVARLLAPATGWAPALFLIGGSQLVLGFLAFRPKAAALPKRRTEVDLEVVLDEVPGPSAPALPFPLAPPVHRQPPPFPSAFRPPTRTAP